jgi:hypothetical protein
MSATQAESVRRSFREFVCRHCGVDPTSVILETTLIRNGSYCGRRFSLSGYSIIWFIDEQQVKLFGRDGGLIRSMSTSEFCDAAPALTAASPIRRAA